MNRSCRIATVLFVSAVGLVAAQSQAVAISLSFTGIVTSVIEDSEGTIEFPGVAAGDSIEGWFRFSSQTDYDFAARIGEVNVGTSDGLAGLVLTNTVIEGFAGDDAFQVEMSLADPGASFLSDRGTPIDTTGFATNSLRFTEGAFDTVVLGEFSTLTVSPIPEPGGGILFCAGAFVMGVALRRRALPAR